MKINDKSSPNLKVIYIIVKMISKALKSLLIFFITIWRRAMCCFRRRRRISCDTIPLTAVGVVSNFSTKSTNTLEDWKWDESNPNNFKPCTVQEHIEYYRQQTIAAHNQLPDPEEPQQDFFEDMTPRITQQTKILINNDSGEHSINISRLSLAPEPIISPEGELGEWEENAGWEEETQSDWDLQSILREKKRQERERRIWEQQQKRQEKVSRPISLGAKIS